MPDDPGEKFIVAQMRAEYARVQGMRLLFDLSPVEAVALVGQLQLALRHPANDGPSTKIARDVIEQIDAFFLSTDCLAIGELIRRGFDPSFDT